MLESASRCGRLHWGSILSGLRYTHVNIQREQAECVGHHRLRLALPSHDSLNPNLDPPVLPPHVRHDAAAHETRRVDHTRPAGRLPWSSTRSCRLSSAGHCTWHGTRCSASSTSTTGTTTTRRWRCTAPAWLLMPSCWLCAVFYFQAAVADEEAYRCGCDVHVGCCVS